MVPPRPRFWLLLVLIYLAYVSLGLPDGLLGTAWPQIRADFHAPLNANWPIYILGMTGGVLSGLSAGSLMRRFSTGQILIATTLLSAATLLACGLSPTLVVLTLLAFLLGLANGAVDAALNHHAATHLSSRHMNWLHGFWGVGVSLGTLSVSAVFAVGGNWRWACLLLAGVQLPLALLFITTRSNWETPPEREAGKECDKDTAAPAPAPDQATLRESLKLRVTWASLASFFFYCGVEFGAGVWATSLLQDGRAWTAEHAALAATCFWASLTTGRFLAGTFSNRLGPRRMLTGALAGVLGGTGLMALSSLVPGEALAGALTVLGLLLTGLSLAPIYPTLMHSTPACVGREHAPNLIGVQAASANLGLTLIPGLLGTLMRISSIQLLGVLLLLTAGLLACSVWLRYRLAVDSRG